MTMKSPIAAFVWMMILLASSAAVANAFITTTAPILSTRCALREKGLFAKDKWDMLIDEDEGEDLQFIGGPPVPRDMKYNMYNLQKQRENYASMKAVGGVDITNDVYARDPEEDTFWFVGKIARVGDVTVEKAMARLWPMIEEHSARLRPVELYPKWGKLELWVSPGDSELDVTYCKPELQFLQMFREIDGIEDISKAVRNVEVGFQGELYENNEEGFRTVRTADGKAVKPELQATTTDRQPTEAELDEMMEILNSQVEAAGE
jgi:hypothetical protein